MRKILNFVINDNLAQLAKTIYDYWFVQFDFPDENGKPYKTSGGKMVYNETLKREIPQGWEVKKLGDVLDIGSGYPFNSDSYIENGKYSVITIKNVQEMYLDLSKTDKINYIPDNIKDFCVLNIGDILISLTGNVGRMCFVDRENLFLNQRVGKFICSKKYLYYIYLLFNREETQNRLSKLANGSSQSNLSPIEVVKDAFIDPSAFVLKNFNDKINLLYGKIIQNQQQIQHLQKLRDTLLPMLMNGQIEVE